MPLEVPKTIARLQPYIKVYAAAYDQTAGLPDFNLSNMNQIFAVQKVSLNNNRIDIHHWRELNTDDFIGDTPSPIKETYPALATYELTLDRVVLYESNMLEAFGFPGHDIIFQFQPLVLAFSLFKPAATTGGPASAKTLFFHGCWLQNNPLEFDVNADDLKIIQSVPIKAAGVRQS